MRSIKFDPTREPDWRFRRAQELLRTRKLPGYRTGDRIITRAVHFLEKWEAAQDDRAHGALFGKNPGLYYAYLIHTAPGEADARFVIQARILAGQDDDQIAGQFGTLPAAIGWYEALFFNVRDRLDDHAFVTKLVRKQANTDSRFPPAVKLLGYKGGVEVLERIMYGFDVTASRPKNTAEVAAYLDRHFEQCIHSRAAVEVAEMEIDSHNAAHLMQVNLRRIELQGKRPPEVERSQLSTAVDHMLQSLRQETDGRLRRKRKGADN